MKQIVGVYELYHVQLQCNGVGNDDITSPVILIIFCNGPKKKTYINRIVLIID